MDPSNSSSDCGYDDKLFIVLPPDYLRCGICSLILRNPIQLLDCGHKYCHVCFQRLKVSTEQNNEALQCPVDRNIVDVSRVFEDIAMRRIVGSLQVKCSYAEGCEWVGELADLQDHSEQCPHKAPVCNGEVMPLVRGLAERVEKCEEVIALKKKEISHLKFNLTESNTKYERTLQELASMKEMVNEIKRERESNSRQIDALSKKLDDVQKKNSALEHEIVEVRRREESFKQEVELKLMTIIERTDCSQTEVKGLGKRRKEELYVASPLQPKDRTLMSLRNQDDSLHVKITDDNHLHFADRFVDAVILPSAAVSKGMKVFYEVNVTELGMYVLRVGWATKEFFSSEEKLGSGKYSYCFEGEPFMGHKLHNAEMTKYGQNFQKDRGHVIGIALDMVAGHMLFGFDGRWTHPMGIAFDDVDTWKTFFPALSYGGGELMVNFGERDFKHGPPDGSYAKVVDIV